jgi:phosphatidylethanolamine N-methyltransferase
VDPAFGLTARRFKEALKWQPRHAALAYGEIKLVAVLLFVIGQILVITSTWKLGITGTFLGDYFGILMDVSPLRVSRRP